MSINRKIKTKQDLINILESYDDRLSPMLIFADFVGHVLRIEPGLASYAVPRIAESVGILLERQDHAAYVVDERASYLEAYLDGKLYNEDSDEYKLHESEYRDIQKEHASTIREEISKIYR